jgi:hypothetical protein
MIAVLHEDVRQRDAEEMASDLRSAFKTHIEVSLVNASHPDHWPGAVNWDDLLIVVYDGATFSQAANDYVLEYRTMRSQTGLLLPVALDPAHRSPPQSAAAIKALCFDQEARGVAGRLVRRVGAMLGLIAQQRDNRIFISYRATDGTRIAEQLESHLISLGYPVWRDEARELDGETKILPGSDVQGQIDQGLEDANIVLLLDTPEAPHSHWIKHEVDTANARLLPVLPLCFRTESDEKLGPRFRSLRDLQRWVPLILRDPTINPPMTESDLVQIVAGLERFACELFQRKCRVPFIVEKEFVSRDFSWKMVNRELLMGESIKKYSSRVSTKVFSHCSIFDQVHGPALDAFSAFLKRSGRPNHALYIYDGELIPEPQLEEIISATSPDDGVVILHHQELAALIDSNFSTFSV